jgi:hypothetical protein
MTDPWKKMGIIAKKKISLGLGDGGSRLRKKVGGWGRGRDFIPWMQFQIVSNESQTSPAIG